MINVNTPWSLDKSMKNIAGGILKGAKNGCILYSITYIIALISENECIFALPFSFVFRSLEYSVQNIPRMQLNFRKIDQRTDTPIYFHVIIYQSFIFVFTTLE